jgi:hypothetical protein
MRTQSNSSTLRLIGLWVSAVATFAVAWGIR